MVLKVVLGAIAALIILFWWMGGSKTHHFGSSTTLVFSENDIQRIWEWEIQSGHWMSWRPIEKVLRPPRNPSLPSNEAEHEGGIKGCGWQRDYVHPEDFATVTHKITGEKDDPHGGGYPMRPPPGSIMDLDLVNEHCSETSGHYLRNCLEYLRVGAGLDGHLRRFPKYKGMPPLPHLYADGHIEESDVKDQALHVPNDWRYIYLEDKTSERSSPSEWNAAYHPDDLAIENLADLPSPNPLERRGPVKIKAAETKADSKSDGHRPSEPDGPLLTKEEKCDGDYPRIFHMYWEGPFDDKPYMTLLSFLYTQNLGLHLDTKQRAKDQHCRPQMWVWIPGLPKKKAAIHLAANAWSAPFLHHDFASVIKFKNWNTTEMMDTTHESWDDAWHKADIHYEDIESFDSHDDHHDGHKVKRSQDDDHHEDKDSHEHGHGYFDYGHNEKDHYTADIARWLLVNQFGGIYIEPGVLFLRDWEEIWGYRGAFLSRSLVEHSRTAVLKLNKASALGMFVLKTAARNNFVMDSHAIKEYIDEADLEEIMYPFPSVLSDLASWSGENHQAGYITMPQFNGTQDFFEVHYPEYSASGFTMKNFFHGAWFYDSHPRSDSVFDRWHNKPDLIERYVDYEDDDDDDHHPSKQSKHEKTHGSDHPADSAHGTAEPWELPWSTVLKRTMEAYLRREAPNMYGEWLD